MKNVLLWGYDKHLNGMLMLWTCYRFNRSTMIYSLKKGIKLILNSIIFNLKKTVGILNYSKMNSK